MPIQYASEPFSEEESLGVLNKYVRSWFTKSFTGLTPPQRYSFKLINERRNTLIAAPTGSGKTMSGFVSIISRLFDYSLAGRLERKVYCIYVSPLRALNNDVYKNLQVPLDAVYKLIAKDKGVGMLKENIRQVTVGVRTGDTTPRQREEMILRPPNILVTTPESLAILLNSPRFSEKLRSVEYVIIDEIHELANNKRGVHLSLSIERLADTTDSKFARIGLGATLHPLEEAAKFLAGYERGKPADCTVVDASWSKKLDVLAMCPVKDMMYSPGGKAEEAIYNELNGIIKAGRTTLVFTNTRSSTERVVFNLKKRFGYGEADIAAHHGSLSKESRLEVEDLLKKGALKCVVSSASLELGVDVGAIDTVVQLGSPKSITRAVQRIGRAGHSFQSVARGRMMTLDRDDLVECAITLDSVLKKHLDSFTVPQNALDVLSQHIAGMSMTRVWGVDEAFEAVRRAYAYHGLERADFVSLIEYLSGKYASLERCEVYGKILYDEKNGTFRKKGQLTQAVYMLNIGTIPDSVSISVVQSGANRWIGNIEEEFLARLKAGDVFMLGGRSYAFESAKGMKAYVRPAHAATPAIPPWSSEQLPLSYELAEAISSFRADFAGEMAGIVSAGNAASTMRANGVPDTISAYLGRLPIDANSKEAIFRYFLEQVLFTGFVPSKDLMLIEDTADPWSDRHYLVFHSLFGRRANDALSRVVGAKLAAAHDQSIVIRAGDNGFMMAFERDPGLSWGAVRGILDSLSGSSIAPLLRQSVRHTELMYRRFRQVAARSFMVLRNYKGLSISVSRQQAVSQQLLSTVEEIGPNFPVLKETYREILNEVMDVSRAEQVLSRIRDGKLKCVFIRTDVPSPFAHGLVSFGHADAIMANDRHEYAQRLHDAVIARLSHNGVADAGLRHDDPA